MSQSREETTVFEQLWQNPPSEGIDRRLFQSNSHGLFVFASGMPKLPYEIVIAPLLGTPGVDQHFSDLDRTMKRKLHETADAFEEKLAL